MAPRDGAPAELSVQLITALALIWSAIQRRHPGVPAVILLPAPAHRDQLNVLGHFAALRWKGRRADEHLHEVVVVAEHLDRPAEDILETLLHEAAHALNFERGIHDYSRSQYHNRHFQQAAKELGLTVERVLHYGFAKTSLPAATLAGYTAEVVALREVLIHRRALRLDPLPPGGPTPATGDDAEAHVTGRSRKAVCQCPYIIRVSKKTVEETTIRCERCGEAFRLV